MGPDGAPGEGVPWQKVLWERQPFPDNYVDQRFLEELRRNVGIRQYRYWTVAREAGFVGQQVSCVAIFITLWLYMEQVLHRLWTLCANVCNQCEINPCRYFYCDRVFCPLRSYCGPASPVPCWVMACIRL